MAELNFNALIPQGPRGFYQGFEQGQDQKIARETNQIKLDELKRDRDEMIQLQEKLKGLGQDPDVGKFLDTLAQTGKPDYVKMAIEGRQKIKDLDAYAKLGVISPVGAAPAMPIGAPAPASVVRLPQPPAPVNALGSGTFGMEPTTPVNAMAPAPAAPAAPVNALAAQPGADQATRAQQRIDQLLMFARTNPRMANQAMAEAKLLQDQLELFSKRGPNKPAALQELEAYMSMTPEQKATFEKLQKIKSPGTTISLPAQEKAFETELGKEQAGSIIKNRTAAQDAASIIDTVKIGRDIMKSGMITGAGADFLVNLNQGLKTVGIDAGYADAAANSQAFTANMAGNVGKLIKQFGAGTGLSDADREFAKDMAGGRISLDAKAINRILDINERAARNVITRHNKDVKGIKTNIPLEVELPPEIKAPAAGSAVTNPQFPGFSIGK
jgi:hypothetical protein